MSNKSELLKKLIALKENIDALIAELTTTTTVSAESDSGTNPPGNPPPPPPGTGNN